MERNQSFSVRYLPRAVKNTQPKSERLYARVTVNGKRVEISTARIIHTGLFNTKQQSCSGKIKEGRLINNFINQFTFRLNEIRQGLLNSKQIVTAEAIKEIYKGRPVVEEKPCPKLLEFYNEHNIRMKSLIGIDISEATLVRHTTSMKHLANFLWCEYNLKDIALRKIDYSFILRYEHYLKTTRKCNHNSTMKYIKNFGKIIRLAIAEQYIVFNPLDKFKVTYKPVIRQVLTPGEIQKLIDLEIDDERLNRVRDLFVFCTYTGLAFIDLKNLRMDHIIKESDGTQWIENTRTKTHILFMIPLLPVPLQLISKYSNHPKRERDGTVLPTLSNQKYNAYLKELATIAGIKKKLTSHIARHTFATTITLNEGIPLEVVSKMLGHSNTRTTQLYAKVQHKAIKDSMQKLMNDDDEKAIAV